MSAAKCFFDNKEVDHSVKSQIYTAEPWMHSYGAANPGT